MSPLAGVSITVRAAAQARGFSLRAVDEDGDCFYSSVHLALGTMMEEPPSVPALRMVVAEKARRQHCVAACASRRAWCRPAPPRASTTTLTPRPLPAQLTQHHLDIARVEPPDDLLEHLADLDTYRARVREARRAAAHRAQFTAAVLSGGRVAGQAGGAGADRGGARWAAARSWPAFASASLHCCGDLPGTRWRSCLTSWKGTFCIARAASRLCDTMPRNDTWPRHAPGSAPHNSIRS